MKEALSIRTTPEDARFNRDNGYELPDCWIATYVQEAKGWGQLEQRPVTDDTPTQLRAARDQACAPTRAN